jgi:hypothetical protein
MSLPANELNRFHKSLVDATFKNFVIGQLKKTFGDDLALIKDDLDELLQVGTLREIKARAGQKIFSRKKF